MTPDATAQTRLVQPGPPHHLAYKAIGAGLFGLNRIRYAVRGYRDPRPFPAADFERAAEYDLAVIAAWLKFLEAWLGARPELAGRSILELGPGADLGVGLALLALGAERYSALDVNPLVTSVPEEFYRMVLDRAAARWPGSEAASSAEAREALLAEVRRALSGAADPLAPAKAEAPATAEAPPGGTAPGTRPGPGGEVASGSAPPGTGRLRYLCRRDSIDLVVSHAALEHFDAPEETFRQLREIVRPGGLLVAQVDLQTHTRWIRDRDPLNIYRLSDRFYQGWRFRGAPNRIRPAEYERMLREAGWSDARALPDLVLPAEYARRTTPHLAPRFRSAESRMEWLTFYLCARR